MGEGADCSLFAVTAGDKAVWTVSSLNSGDVYEVWVTWGADTGYQPNAPFTVSHGTTSESEVVIDQTVAPQATDHAIEIDGVWWVKLGEYQVTDSTLAVTLTQPDSSSPVSADAVLVRPLTVTRFVYDNVGNLLEIFDAEGNNTSYRYDERHRQIAMLAADPDGTNPGAGDLLRPRTEYGYDVASQLIQIRDNPNRYLASDASLPLNRIVSYAYDDLGRMVGVTLPDPDGAGPLTSPTMSYTFDDVGNLRTATDPLNNVTQYDFDFRNRLTTGAPIGTPILVGRLIYRSIGQSHRLRLRPSLSAYHGYRGRSRRRGWARRGGTVNGRPNRVPLPCRQCSSARTL